MFIISKWNIIPIFQRSVNQNEAKFVDSKRDFHRFIFLVYKIDEACLTGKCIGGAAKQEECLVGDME